MLALLWNLLGVFAWASDLMLTAADVAKLPPEQQALYAARPAWAVLATGTAVLGGALGCLGLLLRKRWARALLVLSLVGVIAQDVGLFGMTDAIRTAGPVPMVLQGVVLVVAIGRARMVQGDWIRPGAVVIDVGTNRVEGGLVGDVDFAAAREVAGAITPVPAKAPMMSAMTSTVTSSCAMFMVVRPAGRPSKASCVMKRAAVKPAQRVAAVSRAPTRKPPP